MPDYHWTCQAQRQFLETLAETGSVAMAAAGVNKSRRAAYNLRFRRDGAAFRAGWDAAILIARVVVEDVLMERVIHGQKIERTRSEDGTCSTSTRYDTRLSMALLARLDKMVASDSAEMERARIIMGDYDLFLDQVAAGANEDSVAQFVAERMPQTQEIECELAGNSADDGIWPEDEEDLATRIAAGLEVWGSEAKGWRSNFPPPPGFDGDEEGEFGDPDYCRELTDEESAIQDATDRSWRGPLRIAGECARKQWFGLVDEV